MRKTILLLAFLILSGCSPFETRTPPPPPQPVEVTYTSSLQTWVELLHQCALENPEIALITRETSAADPEFSNGDLTLWFGEPTQGIPGFAASLGMEQIILIAGSNVVLRNVDGEQLQALYSEPDSIYQIWTYSEGNELRTLFESTAIEGTPLTSAARIAPNPAAMMEAIASDPMAIGYIPRSWYSEDVQNIAVVPDLQAALDHPILALSDTEPQGNLQQYLVCLQQSENP